MPLALQPAKQNSFAKLDHAESHPNRPAMAYLRSRKTASPNHLPAKRFLRPPHQVTSHFLHIDTGCPPRTTGLSKMAGGYCLIGPHVGSMRPVPVVFCLIHERRFLLGEFASTHRIQYLDLLDPYIYLGRPPCDFCPPPNLIQFFLPFVFLPSHLPTLILAGSDFVSDLDLTPYTHFSYFSSRLTLHFRFTLFALASGFYCQLLVACQLNPPACFSSIRQIN